jgi:hypothetical protein
VPGSVRRYQVVLLGPDIKAHRHRIVDALERRTNELGDRIWDAIDVLEDHAAAGFDNTSPVVAVWLGSSDASDAGHLATLEALLTAAKPIIPVVRDLANFKAQTPPQLHPINGLMLDGSTATLDRVINTVLEALQLLRRRRRLFVSYARKDSRGAAKQLFGSLAECGFDVFLDTHSTPAAINFQNQLWHSMVDSDLVVLLDTNGFEDSRWCRAEYERADALSIGVVRVIWPDKKIDPAKDALLLSLPVQLGASDFQNGPTSPKQNDQLTDVAIGRIAEAVEGFRARSIAARQANLVTAFQHEASSLSVSVAVQSNLHIIVQKSDGKGGIKRIAVIPTIGVPVSTNYHDAFIEYDTDPNNVEAQLILYDRQGFLPHWVDHLTWLNSQLPVKGIDVTEVPTWLSTP